MEKEHVRSRKEHKMRKDDESEDDCCSHEHKEEILTEEEMIRRTKILWNIINSIQNCLILGRDMKKISMVGISAKQAKSFREKGYEKFLADYKQHREEVQAEGEKPEKEKSSMAGNICCGIFIMLFLVFLVQSKLNEEFWKVYKTRGQEIEDYYETLKVSPDANIREIKKSYRRLALQYHPDRQEGEEMKETFMKISKAYEVLSNKERRDIYDASHGLSSVGSFIKSKTVTLTEQNYRRLVVDSDDFWVIQVYTHDNNICQNLGPEWDKMAQSYSFLKFGRIDFKSQMGLQSQIPFRVAEIPFIYVYKKGTEPDFVQFSVGESIPTSVRKKLMSAFPKSYTAVDFETFRSELEDDSENKIFHLTRSGLDPWFHFEGQYEDSGKFLATKRADYPKIFKYLEEKNIKIEKSFRGSGQFLFKVNPNTFVNRVDFSDIYSLYRFLNPIIFSRENFKKLCNIEPFDEDLEFKRTACILVYENGEQSSKKSIERIHKLYSENYIKEVYGPKKWLEGSEIDSIVIGTINKDSQPHLAKLYENLKENVLVYFSDSKQFKLQGDSSLEEFLEDSLLKVDEEDFNESKAYFSTDFFKKITEFQFLLRENDFSYIRLYFGFFKHLFFGVVGYLAMILFFIPLCIPQISAYRNAYTLIFILYMVYKAGMDTYNYDKKYELSV